MASDPDGPYAGIDLAGPAPGPPAPPDSDPLSSGQDGPTDTIGAIAAAISERRRGGVAKDDVDIGYENWWQDTRRDPLDDVAAAIADLNRPALPDVGGGAGFGVAPMPDDGPPDAI
jgi:hypothetical protein